MENKKYEIDFGGRPLILESGRFAMQANGSVTARCGDTLVLATVVMSPEEVDIGYFPLFVDYEEKFYAAGKIKGSRFVKREGRPSDEAVTNSRLIDRPIRPYFPEGLKNEIQVIVDVLSYDGENDADVLGIIAASAALAVSDVPFLGEIGAVRIGMIEGQYIANPTIEQKEKGRLDLVLAGDADKVAMIEAEANEVSEDEFLEAVRFGRKYMGEVANLIQQMKEEIGKEKKKVAGEEVPRGLDAELEAQFAERINQVLFEEVKKIRKKELGDLKKEAVESEELLSKYGEESGGMIGDRFGKLVERVVKESVLDKGKRIGNRGMEEVRELAVEVGLLPRVHGTGLFKRGETHVLTTVTLGSPGMQQIVDDMEEEYKKRYMHHYNFPPFSVGETKPLRGPSRRDIGHGSLAEKAVEPMIPLKDDFPYTIRLVSEVMSSNGSSSMASVCGSSLALMDAGVPIKKPVAGVAMGLIIRPEDGKWQVLTDLQDLEDIEGGMDFKVAGTKDGITAVQLDTKSLGLTDEIVEQTLRQAKVGRMDILAAMDAVISAPRPELSKYAPRIITLQINPEKIRDVIGPGGKQINEIIDNTGVEIDIEDDGLVMISSVDAGAAAKAKAWVEDLTKEVEVGQEYVGRVTRVMNFGAFVELFPGTEGMIHVSKLSKERVRSAGDILDIGDIVKVKVIEIDNQGRINLSLLEKDVKAKDLKK